jgi:dTDP-4-dehydrorhamnose reductase
MRVAVIGARGQLGSELVKTFQAGDHEVSAFDHSALDVTQRDSVRSALLETKANAVVNAAAFVRVDEAEERPEEALRVNAIGAHHVARACAEMESLCVYVSTDYVFGGEKRAAYTEEDTPAPVNIYGASKLAGEYLVRQSSPRWLIVRLAGLFGRAGARAKGGNFVETILARAEKEKRLRVVDDTRTSPTYAPDAAAAIERLIGEKATGIFHIANEGSCTWHEFARAILDFTAMNVEIERIQSAAFQATARRPANSALTSVRPTPRLRPWRDALKIYLDERRHAAHRWREEALT